MRRITAMTSTTVALFLLAWLLGNWGGNGPGDTRSWAEEQAGSAPAQRPVVDSMHQFMEYYFEPNYKLLKQNLAEAPQDKNAWKPVKAGGLILAEGGNLLLMRVPDEDAARWQKLSVEVRGAAAELYQAARDQDYEAARGHYTKMLTKCNACHTDFADGEHQLKP